MFNFDELFRLADPKDPKDGDGAGTDNEWDNDDITGDGND